MVAQDDKIWTKTKWMICLLELNKWSNAYFPVYSKELLEYGYSASHKHLISSAVLSLIHFFIDFEINLKQNMKVLKPAQTNQIMHHSFFMAYYI